MWKPLFITITSILKFVNLFVEGSRVCAVWTGVGLSLQNTTREGESGKEEDIAMDIWICWARKTIKMSSNAKASANKGTIYYPAIE